MIKNIVLDYQKLKQNRNFKFITDLNFFKSDKTIEFTDGVNIIFSPNGAGKSTLLRMIALSLAAEQGGVSKITTSWYQNIIRTHHFNGDKTNILNGATISHDGQVLNYFNSRKEMGLTHSRDFDPDFSSEGVLELMEHPSSGYRTIQRTRKLFSLLNDYEKMDFSKIERNISYPLSEEAEKILEPKIVKGKPTILMDEPEAGLSPIFQGNFFTGLPDSENFGKFQWIIATHSPFALTLPNVNVINLTEDENYVKNTVNAYKIMLKEISDKY